MTLSISSMSWMRSRKLKRIWRGSMNRPYYAHSLIQDGVIRQLEIIGEAVKRITPVTRSLAPQIPWPANAGMRDKLIHDYFGVDLKRVWLAALTDVPILKTTVTAILATRQANQGDTP